MQLFLVQNAVHTALFSLQLKTVIYQINDDDDDDQMPSVL